jgi:hypothetical protein
VSIATLKRRQQQINEAIPTTTEKTKDYNKIKPTTSLMELKNKYKQEKYM